MRKLKIFTYDKNFVVEYVQSNLIIRILLVFILLSKQQNIFYVVING